jgi:hypothetical protein
MVEGIDFFPTVLDLCGLEIPVGVQGISHARALKGEEAYQAREVCFSECGVEGRVPTLEDLESIDLPESPYSDWVLGASGGEFYWNGRLKMARDERWKLVYYSRGEGELYDMESDPWELDNLYRSADHQDIVAELKERILRWTIDSEDVLPPLRRG